MNLQLKYDKLKEKASKWYDYSYELENKVETLSEELQLLKTKNEELLEHEKENNKTVRSLKRQFREEKEKYLSKITILERDIVLKDGKIQQLEDAKQDLQDRYRELKDDYREQQKWSRGKEK